MRFRSFYYMAPKPVCQVKLLFYYLLNATQSILSLVIKMVDYKLIGARLKKQRETAKLTQEQVAEAAYITSIYLSKIENGKVHPTLDTLAGICDVIGCELATILSNSVTESDYYQNEYVVELFRSCSPSVKPIVIELLEKLAKI